MGTYLRLLWIHLRLGVLHEFQYRANLVVQSVQSLTGLVSALIGLWFIYSKTDTLLGWRPEELLVVLGVYFLVGGLSQVVIQPSLSRFMEDVRLGSLDFTLTKPADAQALIAIRQVEIWQLADVVIGIGVLVVAVVRLGASIGPGEAAAFAVALLAGVSIVFSFLMILATCAFWFVRIQNILVIFGSMYEAGRWPVGLYPPWLRASLTFLVPVGFAITVPAEGLIGRVSLPTLAGAVALAVVLAIVARLFWRVGIRHYSGASA